MSSLCRGPGDVSQVRYFHHLPSTNCRERDFWDRCCWRCRTCHLGQLHETARIKVLLALEETQRVLCLHTRWPQITATHKVLVGLDLLRCSAASKHQQAVGSWPPPELGFCVGWVLCELLCCQGKTSARTLSAGTGMVLLVLLLLFVASSLKHLCRME